MIPVIGCMLSVTLNSICLYGTGRGSIEWAVFTMLTTISGIGMLICMAIHDASDPSLKRKAGRRALDHAIIANKRGKAAATQRQNRIPVSLPVVRLP